MGQIQSISGNVHGRPHSAFFFKYLITVIIKRPGTKQYLNTDSFHQSYEKTLLLYFGILS